MFTTSTGRLHPGWAFVISAVLSLAAFFIAAIVAGAVAGEYSLVLEVIFRSLLALLLIGVYVWLLTIADNVRDHRIAALGLPLTEGWRGQFITGCIMGLGLTVLAVLPIAIWGSASFTVHLGFRLLPRDAAVLVVLLVGAIAVFSVLFGAVHLSNPGASVWD